MATRPEQFQSALDWVVLSGQIVVVLLADLAERATDRVWQRILWLSLLLTAAYRHLWPADWLFEDPHILPFAAGYDGQNLAYRLYSGLTWLGIGTPSGHHALNLAVHVVSSLLVGLVGYRLWRSRDAAWAAGALFLLHPLALPAVGYASALPEMLVTVGALTACWLLLSGQWAGAILVLWITLTVKYSAIGVVAIPLIVWLTVRPIPRRWTWVVLLTGLILISVAVWRQSLPLQFIRTMYPWERWLEEMLPNLIGVHALLVSSISPR